MLLGDRDWLMIEAGPAADLVQVAAESGARASRGAAAASLVRVVDGHEPDLLYFTISRLVDGGVFERTSCSEPPVSEADGVEAEFARALRVAWEARDDVFAWVPPHRDLRLPAMLITDDYLRACLVDEATRRPPFLLARLGLQEAWLGPLLGDGYSCFSCLRRCLGWNLPAHALFHGRSTESVVSAASLERRPSSEVFRALGRMLLDACATPEALFDRVAIRGASSQDTTSHRVHRSRECADCVPVVVPPAGSEFQLQTRHGVHFTSGGLRVEEPQQTFERLSHVIDPLTGVVRRLERRPTREPDLVHAYTAGHSRRRRISQWQHLRAECFDPSGGKGSTLR